MFEQYNDIMSIEDVVSVLGIGKNRVYELLISGKIKAFRIGRVWKIPKQSVLDYIDDQVNNQINKPIEVLYFYDPQTQNKSKME